MALPIRLIVGPDNIMEIPLEAQSVDITVNRNASAFPTPNNIVGRVAIDTNIPEIDIEISGIFQDDDSATFDIEKTKPQFGGGDIVFNFASIMPTTPLNVAYGRGGRLDLNYLRVEFKEDFAIQSGVTDSIDIYDTPNNRNPLPPEMFNEIDLIRGSITTSLATDTIDHPSAGTYSAGSTTVRLDSINGFSVMDRVQLSNGTFVGTITSRDVSAKTISFLGGTKVALGDGTAVANYSTTLFTANGQIVGSVVAIQELDEDDTPTTVNRITLDSINVPIYQGTYYYMTTFSRPPLESILDNKKISLYPNFWRIDNQVSTLPNIPLGVHLVFSNDMAHADYQNEKSGGTQIVGTYPTVTNNGQHYAEYNDAGDRIAGEGYGVYLKLPIGGISTNPVNGNPAATLALIVKKALELTTDVMAHGYITSSNGETLASAFEVLVSGPMLKVKQKDRPINANLISSIEPCLQFDVSENFDVTDEGTIEPASIEFFSDSYIVNSVSVNAKSAGDKVQDLLGIVSNAKKNRDLIRGIQVPYDSLIQSDAVTPTARNFFLTFGQQDNGAKGSSGNTLSASHRMVPQLLPGDLGGETSPDDESSFFDNFGEFGDAVQALGSFVGNFIGDTFVTLKSDPHGNDGGIRIIPEKFHVHYDAGNKYYAYKLILKASDFVIGV